MNRSVIVLEHFDLTAYEQMLTLGAIPQLIQGPPLFEGIALLKKPQLATGCEDNRCH